MLHSDSYVKYAKKQASKQKKKQASKQTSAFSRVGFRHSSVGLARPLKLAPSLSPQIWPLGTDMTWVLPKAGLREDAKSLRSQERLCSLGKRSKMWFDARDGGALGR